MSPDAIHQDISSLHQKLLYPELQPQLVQYASRHLDTGQQGMDSLLKKQLGHMMDAFAIPADGASYDITKMKQIKETYEKPTQDLVAKTILLMTYEAELMRPTSRRTERQQKISFWDKLKQKIHGNVPSTNTDPLEALLSSTYTFPKDRRKLLLAIDDFGEITGRENSIAYNVVQTEIGRITNTNPDEDLREREQEYFITVVDTTLRHMLTPPNSQPPSLPDNNPPYRGGGGRDGGGGPGRKHPKKHGGPPEHASEPIEPDEAFTHTGDLFRRLHN